MCCLDSAIDLNNSFLTVVTPTYNRANLLPRLYESLKDQTCHDFVWLVIDDGSTDNTREAIRKIKDDGPDFVVQYEYKENGGKHTALNLAIEKVKTELFFIVDSDDRLTTNAIETIKHDWTQLSERQVTKCSAREICGISYLRGYSKDEIIGERFSDDNLISDFIEERYNKGTEGDKAEVVATKCLRGFRFPEYKGERFISESVLWIWLAERYDMLFVNKIIYIAEYQEGGLSATGRKLRFQCPHLMAYGSLITMTKRFSLKIRIKETLLYIVYSLFGHFGWKKIFSCKYKGLVSICAVPGWMLYRLWKWKYKM